MPAPTGLVDDLRGASRLAIDAVTGVTDLVEDLHHAVATIAPLVGAAPAGRGRGVSGLVYRGIRGVTRVVGGGVDASLAGVAALVGPDEGPSPRREAVRAAVNGVLGDTLEAEGNPLAITMQLRHGGTALPLRRAALARTFPGVDRLAVFVHGLSMNDLQWTREGHDHGLALQRDLGFAPVQVLYNSGRRIDANGADLAALLERLAAAWPVPLRRLVLVGHSMGGLVARSACHHASLGDLDWLRRLDSLACLGSPHHGAPLEQAGSRVDAFLGISPYLSPFARLGRIRSAGVQDLRHGHVVADDDGARHEGDDGRGTRRGVRHPPLLAPPAHVRCFLVAGTRQKLPGGRREALPGDGLVPVASALALHRDPARALRLPTTHRFIAHGSHHFDLLSSQTVYARLQAWLADAGDASTAAGRSLDRPLSPGSA